MTTPRDVIREPLCRPEDLGAPIPDSPHAVSVALPRWQDVVDYEEGDPALLARLRAGYPRFRVHDRVRELARRLSPAETCLPFPSRRAAEQCAAYIVRRGADARVVTRGPIVGVVTDASGAADLAAFWQHTGWIVSSRHAQALLDGRIPHADAAQAARRDLCRTIAGYYDCQADDVLLQPTGMAAFDVALRALNAWRPTRPTLQLGFPYTDSLKIQQRVGRDGARFLCGGGATLLEPLRALLRRERVAACFCEIPGNPLLDCVNVDELAPLLRAHDTPLIADDVVATPFNVDLGRHADLVVTSLTKYLAGTGDVMGGAVIRNPRSRYYDILKEHLRAQQEDLLWIEDAEVLNEHAAGFPARMRRHNAGGLYLAERLRAHPAIDTVWYPKWVCGDAYERVRRRDGGWGGLLSFLPKDAARVSPRLYDALPICKGPTLGTVFTLACPFTLLAHYRELDWAESCGVSRYLIRISTGIEDPPALWQGIAAALAAATAPQGGRRPQPK